MVKITTVCGNIETIFTCETQGTHIFTFAATNREKKKGNASVDKKNQVEQQQLNQRHKTTFRNKVKLTHVS